MASQLSNMKCEKAAPQEKPYSISDNGGLYLWITPSGGKLWRWGYRFEGKQKLMSFGKYPDVSLARARVSHAEARALRASGVDPMAARKEVKEESKAEEETNLASEVTFETLARRWMLWWRTDKGPRTIVNIELIVERDLVARIGLRPAQSIKRLEAIQLVKEISAAHSSHIAKRALQCLSQIFNYGLDHGLLDENFVIPTAAIKPARVIPRTVSSHHPSLEVKEIPALLAKIHDYGGSTLTKLAMELLSLTVLRTSELIEGRWTEIDWAEKRWNVPAARMKMKTRHIVPLSRQAIEVLKHAHSLSGDTDFIFPNQWGALKATSRATMIVAMHRMGYRGRMTGHGWRSIFSTYLNEHGFPPHLVETQLAHLTGTEVQRAYNYALYLEPRAKMMQHWADFLDECRADRKSVPGNAQAA